MTIAAALLYALASGALQTAPVQTAPQTPPVPTAEDEQDQQPSGAPATTDDEDADVVEDVLVTGARARGSVRGDIEPDITLTSEQLAAYGATNVAELLAAVEPLTRSGRGRGDGGPVVLLNGRRTSGFQEIRGIPFEAIERFEILPEEVALTYGFAADQRVVNIILKADFRQGSLQGRVSGPSQGGRTTTGAQISAFQVNVRDRWNFELEQTHNTALFEDERDINRSPGSQPFDLIGNVAGIPYGSQIDPALTTLAGTPVTVAANPGVSNPTLAQFAAGANAPRTGDLGAYRTLLPRGDTTRLTASWARDLNETIKGTVSLSLNDTASFSYLGLPGVTLQAPAGRNGSPFSRDVAVYRYIADPGAVTRDSETLSGNLGLLLDGYLGDYRWSVSGAYDRVETDTTTGRGLDATAAQAAVTAGTLNPFGALSPSSFTRLVDTANSVASGGNLEAVVSGDLFEAPAGGLNMTLKLGGDTRTLDSESTRAGLFSARSIGRDRAYGLANFTLPVSDPSREILGFLGDLSVNFNAGYDHASDFGGLMTLGAGFNWVPADPLSVIVSYTDEEGAPTIQQLNDPVITTPNAAVFDFRTGQTVLVNRIDGGNAGLDSDNRNVWKVGLNFKPWSARDFSVSTNYTSTTIENAISAFPTITADLEAALPSRFTRDSSGQLISIDARPLNYSETRREELRTGFNFSRAFGTPTPPAAGAPGAGGMPGLGGGRPGGAGGPPAGAGGGQGRPGGGTMMFGGGGRGGFGGGQPGQGRFNLSVYHTYRFTDRIVIADGLPVLDLLDGAATGSRGGTPRNEVQVQGGVFKSGLGAFVNANWLEGTEVDGGLGGSDLTFGSQTTVNLNVFADLSSRPTWVAKYPWLKGSRINLGIQNLFDSRQDVRSSTGDVGFNYQPDFLDPQGRVVTLTFRKILF
ncbi:TonB-dependent receptor [Brevundimonas subvibrioides]|uniref:TonB-dependent receptor plug n=1 Tax=Brevundimonas subvibrioides (strain ATCC 15264 / DSM 4735 / LMG 14903 / NBRC 16000 / CB 81) TaxID=633149 RepID=D9QNP8_BRESC|nr:TonB-dependent receptor [Brevundimonas subvibrioides]ADL02283.1 TonB-dependent receptor plug [Brevundimonas subvibrioides ATCC 15264]